MTTKIAAEPPMITPAITGALWFDVLGAVAVAELAVGPTLGALYGGENQERRYKNRTNVSLVGSVVLLGVVCEKDGC